jgi:hypothetical protein
MKVYEANRKRNKSVVIWVLLIIVLYGLFYNSLYSVFNQAIVFIYFIGMVISVVLFGVYLAIMFEPLEQRKSNTEHTRANHYFNRCKYYLSINNIEKAVYFYNNGIRHIKISCYKEQIITYYGYLMAKQNKQI